MNLLVLALGELMGVQLLSRRGAVCSHGGHRGGVGDEVLDFHKGVDRLKWPEP